MSYERLFKLTRAGRGVILTADEVLEELRNDLDEADPGELVKFPDVEAVALTAEEYEKLREFDGW